MFAQALSALHVADPAILKEGYKTFMTSSPLYAQIKANE